MALDLSMIPQVSAPSLSADFFKEMANARQTAFNGLVSPIQATSKAFVDNRTQQAQELIRQAQSVGDMQSPDLQAGIQDIIGRSGGFVDQNAINKAQQDHLTQLFGNQQTYAKSEGMDKDKTQEQVNLLVQQKIAQGDYEGARAIAQSSVTSAGLANLGGAVTSAENAPLDRQLDVLTKLGALNHTATGDANQTNQVAAQMIKVVEDLEAQAVAAESRTIKDGLGRTIKDPAGAAQAAAIRSQAAQYRSQIQTSSPQQVLGAVGGAYGDVGSTVQAAKVGNTQINEPQAKAASQAQSWGWNSGAVAGLMGNLHIEGGWQGGVGDGGKAKGIAQWHPDRQKNFQQVIGKPVSEASHEEQMNFIKWEVDSGKGLIPKKYNGKQYSVAEQQKLLTQTTDPAQAAVYWDVFYERSAGKHTKERSGHAVNYAQALANNSSSSGVSTVTAASAATSRAGTPATATAASSGSGGLHISQLPPEDQTKFKPYTDKKGNFLPIKFSGDKSIDTLDASIEALVAKGQSEIDQAYQVIEAKRDLQGIDKDVAGWAVNPFGSDKDKIELYNLVKQMPIYANSKGDRPVLTDTELNEVIQATAAELDSNGKWDNDKVRLSTLQRMLSNAAGRKADTVYKTRNKTVADGLAGLAKEYGTTVAVLEQVLNNRGTAPRFKTGADAFIKASDITPKSSTPQAKKEAKEKSMSKFETPRPAPNPKSIFANLNQAGIDPRIAAAGTSPLIKHAALLK